MLNVSHIARPYAKAAFDYALEHDDIVGWQQVLADLAAIVTNNDIIHLIKNPGPRPNELAQVCIDLVPGKLTKQQQNFIKVLANNHRLLVLNKITEEYNQLVREHNETIAVTIFTAESLSDVEQQKLQAALERKVKQQVKTDYQVDKTLIGGLVVQIGDSVIDNSIAGQLSRLKASLVE